MDAYQKSIFADIQAEKAKEKPDRALIRRLARRLTAPDDRTAELKRSIYFRLSSPGRSPSFGRWASDDERT